MGEQGQGQGQGQGGAPQDANGGGGTAGAGGQAPKTFTQEQLDAIINDRLERERRKYGDYEELKKAAGELEKIKQGQMTEALLQQTVANPVAVYRGTKRNGRVDRFLDRAWVGQGLLYEKRKQAPGRLGTPASGIPRCASAARQSVIQRHPS